MSKRKGVEERMDYAQVKIYQETQRDIRLLAAYKGVRIPEAVRDAIRAALREWEATAPRGGEEGER